MANRIKPRSYGLTDRQIKIIGEKSKQLGVSPSEFVRRILDKYFGIEQEVFNSLESEKNVKEKEKHN